MKKFTSFYNAKYTGRKLEVLLSKSRGEIVCNHLQRKYTFVVGNWQRWLIIAGHNPLPLL